MEECNVTKFRNQLKSLQGKTFEGQLQNAPANDDFEGKRLIMHVLYSDDEKILIPFNVGDNRSRTWIFTRKDGRIELQHDHRHLQPAPHGHRKVFQLVVRFNKRT